jgi:hypothetical protein
LKIKIYVYICIYIYIYGIIKEIVTIYINLCCFNIIHCVRKVAVHLGYGRVQLKCDGTRWRTGGEVRKFAVHLLKVMEVMSTNVCTGLNPSNFNFNWTVPLPKCAATSRTHGTIAALHARILIRESTDFSKIWEPPQNFRCQNCGVKLSSVPWIHT